jgi:hypothetical protein
MRRGAGAAIVDALVVEPKVAGIGIDLAKLARFSRESGIGERPFLPPRRRK